MMQFIRFGFRKSLILAGFFGSIIHPPVSWSAPCCARTAAAPFLILGDDQAQLSMGISAANVVAESFDEGKIYFLPRENYDDALNFRLDGALLLSDRLQAGASFSLLQRSVSSYGNPSSALGIGDTRISLGYEFLPAWTFSKWKPQGFLFSVISLPTGVGREELQDRSTATISGNGVYSLSVGSIFVKRWSDWDAFALGEVHYSLPRTFNDASGSFTLFPGFGGSLGLGGGWSPGGGLFRVGFRVQPRIDQGRRTPARDLPQETKGILSSCDTGLDVSYLVTGNDTLMLSYTDQTLLGIAKNSNLTRSIAINFQHRWER